MLSVQHVDCFKAILRWLENRVITAWNDLRSGAGTSSSEGVLVPVALKSVASYRNGFALHFGSVDDAAQGNNTHLRNLGFQDPAEKCDVSYPQGSLPTKLPLSTLANLPGIYR